MILIAALVRAPPEGDDGVLVFLRRTKPVNAGDRRDDKGVLASE